MGQEQLTVQKHSHAKQHGEQPNWDCTLGCSGVSDANAHADLVQWLVLAQAAADLPVPGERIRHVSGA